MTVVLSSVAMQPFAQVPINTFRQMFDSGAVFIDMEYDVTVPNTMVTGHSSILIQGDMYHLQGDGLDVYNNGKSVWTVDESAREVVVESSADVSEDYISNPVLLLSRMDDFFQVKSRKAAQAHTEYVLQATSDCGISQANLILSADGKLISGVFSLDDGNVLSIKVKSMKKTEEMPMASFSPKGKFGSDWIVTDLR